jgi:electron transfer flavoprotein alpha/beta subunit
MVAGLMPIAAIGICCLPSLLKIMAAKKQEQQRVVYREFGVEEEDLEETVELPPQQHARAKVVRQSQKLLAGR